MRGAEIEKSNKFIVVEIIEYIPNSIVIKTIIKKTTGNISAVSIDAGEGFPEKVVPFESFVQIIDGRAEIIIDGISHLLNTGQSIIIQSRQMSVLK